MERYFACATPAKLKGAVQNPFCIFPSFYSAKIRFPFFPYPLSIAAGAETSEALHYSISRRLL
jgi:hypothetical protein